MVPVIARLLRHYRVVAVIARLLRHCPVVPVIARLHSRKLMIGDIHNRVEAGVDISNQFVIYLHRSNQSKPVKYLLTQLK